MRWVAGVLFLSTAIATLLAQSVQVRVLDAKSGARVPNEKVSVLIKGEKDARDYTTDSEGKMCIRDRPRSPGVPYAPMRRLRQRVAWRVATFSQRAMIMRLVSQL